MPRGLQFVRLTTEKVPWNFQRSDHILLRRLLDTRSLFLRAKVYELGRRQKNRALGTFLHTYLSWSDDASVWQLATGHDLLIVQHGNDQTIDGHQESELSLTKELV